MINELKRLSANQYSVLILDNEVTVGEFVTAPPLPWTRFAQRDGVFKAGQGYPCFLTAEQAKFEMRNWDEVSLPAIRRALAELDGAPDCVLFGNNAGQGLLLAQSLAPSMMREHAAIIYASSLPEKSAYDRLGYRMYFRRSEATARLLEWAKISRRPLALFFINTIQHNSSNYHDP